jgi:hypothetical protein
MNARHEALSIADDIISLRALNGFNNMMMVVLTFILAGGYDE